MSGILHIFAATKLRRDMRDELVLVVNGPLTAAEGANEAGDRWIERTTRRGCMIGGAFSHSATRRPGP